MILSPPLVIKARKAFIIAHGTVMNGIFETTKDCEKFFDEAVMNEHFTEKFFRDYAARVELDSTV